MRSGGAYKFQAKDVAYPALMSALLVGGQYLFSFVAGVEIVTALLACFSAAFGVKRGVLCAVSFSLLRCFLFGFVPNVIVLYLIYYPAFAAAFGGLGKIKDETFARYPLWMAAAVNALLLGLAVAAGCAAGFGWIKASRIVKATLTALLWAVFGLCAALALSFDGLYCAKKFFGKETGAALKTVAFTAVAAAFTVSFTLLDDVISPLMLGYTRDAALAYFYASFTAMLPQVVCTAVTVSCMLLPVTAVFRRIKK